jgi:hypothetical protein
LENGESLLSGEIRDQQMLHEYLESIRALQLPLISVARVEPDLEDVFLRLMTENKREKLSMHNLTVTHAVRPRMLVRRGQSIMSALQIILNETAKRLLTMIDYKFNLLMEMLVLALIFIGATFFLGNGSFNSRLLPAELLDKHIPSHGHRKGLSVGELSIVWLALRLLSDDVHWQAYEQELMGQLVRVYDLQAQCVRIDTTTASSYVDVTEEGLLQLGHEPRSSPRLASTQSGACQLGPVGHASGYGGHFRRTCR